MADLTLEQLLEQAETHEEPETTDKPQEDVSRPVPQSVDIEEHRSQGVS